MLIASSSESETQYLQYLVGRMDMGIVFAKFGHYICVPSQRTGTILVRQYVSNTRLHSSPDVIFFVHIRCVDVSSVVKRAIPCSVRMSRAC
jgi:hypothetical protein